MGMISPFVTLFYIAICFGISILVFKLTKKRYLKNIVFATLLILPIYDLIIQKGIKTYYQLFKMNDTIYSYPIKDENGRIESLGTNAISIRDSVVYDLNNTRVQLFWKKNLSGFLEMNTVDEENNNKEEYIHINFNNQTHYFTQTPSARYFIKAGESKPKLFGLYEKREFEIVDTKTNKVLAKSWSLYFPSGKDTFRYKYLLWAGDNGSVMAYVDGEGNIKEITEKVLGFNFHLWSIDRYIN